MQRPAAACMLGALVPHLRVDTPGLCPAEQTPALGLLAASAAARSAAVPHGARACKQLAARKRRKHACGRALPGLSGGYEPQ